MKIYKTLLLAFVLLFSVDAAVAQTSGKEQRKIERAEKKRLKEEARKKEHESLMSMVQDQAFVLEAYTLTGRNMNRYQVAPNTNFVSVEGDRLTVQTANGFNFGYNGLGGITINGTITDYKVLPSKNNKSISVLIQFTSPLVGQSVLNLNINSGGNSSAFVRDNWGGRVTFQGQIVELEESGVFEGQSII